VTVCSTGRAGLHGDIRDPRRALGLIADAKRVEKFQLTARPHPPRQRHRRQEAAAGRVPVRPEHRHRKHRLPQAPMHREWCRVAFSGLADLLEQCRAQAHHEMRGDDVGRLGAAADPLPQMIEIEFLGHDDFRARGVPVATCSSIAGTGP
jgi:hypothetical protein